MLHSAGLSVFAVVWMAHAGAAQTCPALVAEIGADMTLPHVARPLGVPDFYDWSAAPRLGYGNVPGSFAAFIAWGQVYPAIGGNPAANTRVEIGPLRAWVRDASGVAWREMHPRVRVVGGAFLLDFDGNTSVDADLRLTDPDGVSVQLTEGRNFHFWPETSRVTIGPEGLSGIVVTVTARLVLDDPTGPDDRDQARLMMGVGADYWADEVVNWDDSGRVVSGDAGIGRFGWITKDWSTFSMTTLSEADLCANPPDVTAP